MDPSLGAGSLMFCFFWEYLKYFQISLISSGRCAPERFEYFCMPQMFIRSSSACIKIQAKSSGNVYIPWNEFSVWNRSSTSCPIYAFSFYGHICTTLNSEVWGIHSGYLQNSSRVGSARAFSSKQCGNMSFFIFIKYSIWAKTQLCVVCKKSTLLSCN